MRTRSVFVIVTAFVIVAVVILAGVLYFRSSATVIANLHSAAYDYTVPCGVAIIGQPVHEGSLNPGEVLPFVLEYHWWGKDPVSITVTAQAGPGENWVLDEENIVVYPGHSYTVDLYL